MKSTKILLTTVLCAISMCAPVFAEGDPNEKTVPIKLTATASATTIDVGVTEAINVTCAAGTSNLVYDEFEIVNYSSLGQVSLDGLTISPQNGWQVVSKDTKFASLEKNSKKFSIVLDADGDTVYGYNGDDFDFSTQSGVYTLTHGDVLANVDEGCIVLNFEGNIGIQTSNISEENIANLVVTLSIY